MSRDWTKEETAAASAAMKKMGQMGYEEFLAEVERQDKEKKDLADQRKTYETTD